MKKKLKELLKNWKGKKMKDDIFNSFDFNSFGIDETIAEYIHSCDLKKLQELKEFVEQVEEGKLNCFLIENRKKWG